jgi:hypothetical protein
MKLSDSRSIGSSSWLWLVLMARSWKKINMMGATIKRTARNLTLHKALSALSYTRAPNIRCFAWIQALSSLPSISLPTSSVLCRVRSIGGVFHPLYASSCLVVEVEILSLKILCLSCPNYLTSLDVGTALYS